ncbi:DNA replication protein [Mycoemilia scoparia]|uniref:DNA replication complex GINS protein PSF3 n=1 Tax=Mycoemilia scoparia TaxID=417184 RepID=A0A9W7ZZ21_9FUNG|nr:DNA replication protein [Mycoemilia scoparia]
MSNFTSLRPNYFDIDDIMAQTQRVPCIFNIDVDGLGTDSMSESTTVSRNTRLALPFWMADKLNEEEVVDMEAPKAFSKRAKRMFGASSVHVDMHNLCPYFYKLGGKIAEMDPELPDVLGGVFMERIQMLADAAQRSHAQDVADFVSQLDETEKKCKQ